jgi:rubrerythrin
MEDTLEHYLSVARLLDWRPTVRAAETVCIPNDIARAIAFLSGIETDSRIIRKKLAVGGIDQEPVFQEFLITWMAEEAEHGRALAAIASKAGVAVTLPRRSRFKLWEVGALAGMRAVAPRVVQATYCVLGTSAEFIALSTYTEIARCSENETVKRVLLDISRQESHHMRFYRNVGTALLADDKTAARARKLLAAVWRPPGIDLVGEAEHREAFGFLLKRSPFHQQLAKLDRILDQLPGLDGMDLMRRWLERNVEGYAA